MEKDKDEIAESSSSIENISDNADVDFDNKKEAAKSDFDLACDLYRRYVGGAETKEERMRRIQKFRCG